MVKLSVLDNKNPEKYKTIMGIDSSSLGIAWAFRDGDDLTVGKIRTDKIKELPDKINTGCIELYALLLELKPDFLWVEKSIFVKNPGTARTLSYVVGGIMATCALADIEVGDVDPATWKAYLGYKNLKKDFVKQTQSIMGTRDGKKFCEHLRKNQTRRIIEHNYPNWQIPDDHDISDAVGICVWGWQQLVEDEELEISRDISLDLPELADLGLEL